MIGMKDGLGKRLAVSYDVLTDSTRYSRVDVGNPVSKELEEVCAPRTELPGSSYYCYTPVKHTLDTSDFYRSLNNPFSTLPDGNESLSQSGSPVLELHSPMAIVTDVFTSAPNANAAANEEVGEARVSYRSEEHTSELQSRGHLV